MAQSRARIQERYRARVKERKAAEKELQEESRFKRDTRVKLCYFGEVRPGVDARTYMEEIQIHREFLRALGRSDVYPGETLAALAKRTWFAWVNFYPMDNDPRERFCPGFRRGEQRFDYTEGMNGNSWGFRVTNPLDFRWTPPADCFSGKEDEPIDIDVLPELPPAPHKPETKQAVPAAVVEPKPHPEAPPTEPRIDYAAIQRDLIKSRQELAQMGVPPGAL